MFYLQGVSLYTVGGRERRHIISTAMQPRIFSSPRAFRGKESICFLRVSIIPNRATFDSILEKQNWNVWCSYPSPEDCCNTACELTTFPSRSSGPAYADQISIFEARFQCVKRVRHPKCERKKKKTGTGRLGTTWGKNYQSITTYYERLDLAPMEENRVFGME